MDQFLQIENFGRIAPYAELFWQGTLVTVLLAVFTVMIGFCLALILALMRMSNLRPSGAWNWTPAAMCARAACCRC